MDNSTIAFWIAVIMIANILGVSIGIYFKCKRSPEFTKKEIKRVIDFLYYIGLFITGISIPLCIYDLSHRSLFGLLLLGIGIILLYNYRDQSKLTPIKFQIKTLIAFILVGIWGIWACSLMISLLISQINPIDRILQCLLILITALIIPRILPKLIFIGEGKQTYEIFN